MPQRWTLCLLLCLGGVSSSEARQPALRVLFIGNSLTYSNDLPAMVAGLARAVGRSLHYQTVALPDFSLEDHWNSGDARRAIAQGGWSVVVLQQGPSALPESQRVLIRYVRQFDTEIRRAGARTALYMVWPASVRRGDFVGVSQSYAAAATAVGGLLLPAGDTWRAAWAIDSRLPLYGPDGFHPSEMGSRLSALVIARQLLGPLPPDLPLPGTTPAQAATLRQATEQTVERLERRR